MFDYNKLNIYFLTIILKNMKKLTNQQMINVQAGAPVTWEEYCATVRMIAENNPENINDGTILALSNCALRNL